VIVEVDRAAGVVHKRAETADQAVRLRAEAGVLDVARHPSVVQRLAAGRDTLTLALVDGPTLRQLGPRTPAEVTRIGAMAADTLADLHDIGVTHGDLTAEHLLIDGAGCPVLCGFGRGTANGRGHDVGAAARDVAALSRVLAAATTDAKATRRVERAAAEAARDQWPARRLATLLAAGELPTRGRRARVGATVVGAAVMIVATFSVLVASGAGTATSSRAGSPRCPAVDRGCRPIGGTAGVIKTPTGRYRIGQPGDVVVVGRWRCAAALPALLRPATGEVWVWDAWAGPGAPQAARLATRVPQARSIVVEPGSSGCDRLRVVRADGGTVGVGPDGSA
jgi:tRNA A-37 threonylcarbamoyl transferase component Bud32